MEISKPSSCAVEGNFSASSINQMLKQISSVQLYAESEAIKPCPTSNVGNFERIFFGGYRRVKLITQLIPPHPVLQIEPANRIESC